MSRKAWGRTVRVLVLLIGLHSCALGVLMLLAPHFMLLLLGFQDSGSVFFPSQSGIFLLILGAFYLYGLAEPAIVRFILLSKVAAVAFLISHAAFLSAPPAIWAAAAGDTVMLIGLAAAWHCYRRSILPSIGNSSRL